jgi:hypothetical protein
MWENYLGISKTNGQYDQNKRRISGSNILQDHRGPLNELLEQCSVAIETQNGCLAVNLISRPSFQCGKNGLDTQCTNNIHSKSTQ